MQAIIQKRWGGPEVLELAEIDRPTVADNQVLVRVRAAGVHRAVWHLMTGLPYLVRLMGYGFRRPKNLIPGLDLAGDVEAVGPAVTRFRPGDRVYGTGYGTFAEFACVSEDALAPIPANLDFAEAATVPYGGLTALQGLRDHGRVSPGQKVLVIGASGAVGAYAVQLAREMGAEVTGICSAGKAEWVENLGANDTIDYLREDISAGGLTWDLIVDIAGRRPIARLRRALAPQGTLVLVGGEGGDRWTGGSYRMLIALAWSPLVRQRLCSFITSENAADLEVLNQFLAAGTVRPMVDRSFRLTDAAEAIRYLESGRARGQIVIAPAAPKSHAGAGH